MSEHVAPDFKKDAFNCPHCRAYADQKWNDLTTSAHFKYSNHSTKNLPGLVHTAKCKRCGRLTIWHNKKKVYPRKGSVSKPAKDMPEEIKEQFNEARAVFEESPQAAGGLLRVCLEKLLEHLEAEGGTSHDKIGYLVDNGLNEEIQKAMDSVRLIGNDHSHSGEIFMNDSREAVSSMFDLINTVVIREITEPKNIDEIWDKVPDNKKKGVKDRDN